MTKQREEAEEGSEKVILVNSILSLGEEKGWEDGENP